MSKGFSRRPRISVATTLEDVFARYTSDLADWKSASPSLAPLCSGRLAFDLAAMILLWIIGWQSGAQARAEAKWSSNWRSHTNLLWTGAGKGGKIVSFR